MSKKVLKSWTESSYETIEISHVWKINGFSLRKNKIMYSSIFSSMIQEDGGNEKKLKWRMRLYPDGETEESKGYLTLRLSLMNPTAEEEIEVSRSFSMHDENGNCLKQMPKSKKTYSETSTNWGFSKFHKREDLLNKLPNDILKITCNLSYINVLNNVSGTIEESSTLQEETVPCNLIENFGAMLNNNDFSDVSVIILGEGEERTEFKAHKNILAARSPYFAAMLTHDFKEKAENIVEINDVTPEVFKKMLTYIYTGKMEPQNMNENDAKELLVTADRFALDNLKTAVKNLLVSKLNVENVSELLVLGHVHSAETLKTRASDFVAANLEQVMKTEGWKNMIREHPHLMEPILGAVTGSKKNTERALIDTSSDSDSD